jgi:(1->4)-alpha-D-glucan 1-alpha-D-glucosylmutase
VKLASPGVPDLYQGTELWDFSLVDPDNRRPVDYPRRIAMLDELQRTFAGDAAGWPERLRGMLAGIEDGRIKLYCVWRALGLRERSSGLFAHGSYVPVPGAGDKAAHVCAFWRRHEDQALLAVAPRLIAQLAGEERFALGAATWGDTRIELPEAATSLRDELTGRTHAVAEHAGKPTLRLAEVLDVLPVALLTCG